MNHRHAFCRHCVKTKCVIRENEFDKLSTAETAKERKLSYISRDNVHVLMY